MWVLFSNVWSENTALFERLMEIHSNSPKLYYGFNMTVEKKYGLSWINTKQVNGTWEIICMPPNNIINKEITLIIVYQTKI